MRALLTTIACLAAWSCGGPARVVAPAGVTHVQGDAWFTWRAQSLGVTVEAARARDAALAEDAPPETIDPAVRERAAATWAAVCATCHGPDGKPPERPGQPTPKAWGGMGPAMGFTFGGDKMRAGIYRHIRDGKGAAMPAWSGQLAREHMWALVQHIESF